MNDDALIYPIELDRAAIADLLPHRGAVFVCRSLRVVDAHHFVGTASWMTDNAVIEGHFPGMPIVPGVMLIESLAQLAGAGLLAGDPVTRAMPSRFVGLLAGVRNCWFKQPVFPGQSVRFDIACRQLAPQMVQVGGEVHVDDREVARLELSLAYVEKPEGL